MVVLLMPVMLLMFCCIVALQLPPLLEMRRRFKAVMDVLDAMILNGFSLSRSLELTAQWDRILAIGLLYPVALYDLRVVRSIGVGEFHRIVFSSSL